MQGIPFLMAYFRGMVRRTVIYDKKIKPRTVFFKILDDLFNIFFLVVCRNENKQFLFIHRDSPKLPIIYPLYMFL